MVGFDANLVLVILFGVSVFSFQAKGETFWFVDDDTCPEAGSGSSVDPFCSIQAGVVAAIDGDIVIVFPGTYIELINFNGKAITLRSTHGASFTTIDGHGAGSVVTCMSDEGPGTVLDGFTITGGTGTTCYETYSCGGGMYNDQSSPTVMNCTFSGNNAFFGGGMYNRGPASNPTVTYCTFSANTADCGGGMYNIQSDPTVTHCTFSANTADSGGGMDSKSCHPAVANCTFSGNRANYGGGMSNRIYCIPTVTNCAFIGNTAIKGAGIHNIDHAYPTVTNCTFSGNVASDGGGGMYNFHHAFATVTNCILWGDSPDEILNINSEPPVSFCNVQGGLPAGTIDEGGNIDADPLFTPGPLGCYYLSQIAAGQAEDSPCVDAGDPDSLTPGGTTRSDEVPDTGVVDMGYHWPISGQPLVMGDSDHDQDVDFADFADLQSCFTGEGPTDVPPCCRIFDFESDEDVDFDDVAAYLDAVTGP